MDGVTHDLTWGRAPHPWISDSVGMSADDGVRVHPGQFGWIGSGPKWRDLASDELICGLLGLGRVYVMGRILGLGLATEKVEILPNKRYVTQKSKRAPFVELFER